VLQAKSARTLCICNFCRPTLNTHEVDAEVDTSLMQSRCQTFKARYVSGESCMPPAGSQYLPSTSLQGPRSNLLAGLHVDEVAQAHVVAVNALQLVTGGGPVGGSGHEPGGLGGLLQAGHAALCAPCHVVLDRVACVKQHQQPRALQPA
jgi:hypothetical protein